MSVPRALLLVLALLQAAGVTEVMRRQICAAACRDDGDTGCTPDGDSPSCQCHCPSLQTQVPAAIASVSVAPAPRPAPPFPRTQQALPSPDPREISHVPRRNV